MRQLEQLESRRLLASFTASSVAELISDINAANAAGGTNTITLAAGASFKLTAVDNTTDGPTGLPVIAAGNDLTIVGNGDTLQRSTAKGTPAFRLFGVDAGASLTLNNLTLSGGMDLESVARGGAIRSLGALTLNHVTVQNCTAQSQAGNGPAFGGGIFSGGASAVLTVVDSAIRNNQALGTNDVSSLPLAGRGGSASGGGVYAYGSSASLTNTTIDSNIARGGNGSNGGKYFPLFSPTPVWVAGGEGGDALGGGVYAVATVVELKGMTVTRNAATAGTGGSSPKGLPKGADGVGQGGGLYVAPGAVAGLDAFTQANIRSNTASTGNNDIFGTFTILA